MRMRKSVVLGLTILCLAGLSGCGNSYASAMQRVLRDLAKLRAAYKTIKQKDQVAAAVPKIQAARTDLDADVARLVALEPSSEAARQKLHRKYAPALQSIVSRVQTEQARVGGMEGGNEAVSAGALPEALVKLAKERDEAK
jgi:adenylosuccinate lyase